MVDPVVIILAAGRGERFLASGAQRHKLDTPLGERTLLEHVIHAVEHAGLAWHLVRPAGGTGGMGDSIALGVNATSNASGWLILPADLPLIAPESLLRVADGLGAKPLVVPWHQQHQGHPVAFSQSYFPALRALTGDSGAKSIVQQARAHGEVLDLPLEDAGIIQDIDTLEDLRRAERIYDNPLRVQLA
ncbi:nucleotidyltransferase family protein [Kosakonia cowanii]|uniref:nucleotidyltransferase family protein n=1 Tax=Kosakonia cowanii TaxID=208223 RepID=UPI0039A6A002